LAKDGVAGYLNRKFTTTLVQVTLLLISAAPGNGARDMKGEKFKVVAVIGDGALTGV